MKLIAKDEPIAEAVAMKSLISLGLLQASGEFTHLHQPMIASLKDSQESTLSSLVTS